MKCLGRKILSLVIAVTLAVSGIISFIPLSTLAEGNSTDFPGMLGEEWSVSWNGTKNENGDNVSATELVRIVDEDSNTGRNSLRIGHDTAATRLTLKFSLSVEAGSYQFSAYTKTVGAIEWFTTTVYDGSSEKNNNPLGAYNPSNWTKTTILTDGTESVEIASGTMNVEFYIQCDAGKYVYLDDFDVVKVSKEDVQLNPDNSFERWHAQINTEGEYTYSDFVNIVEGKATEGEKSLRIGNKDVATDIVLTLTIAQLESQLNTRTDFSADYYVEGETLLEGSQMHWGILSAGANDRKIDLSSKLPTGDWYTASREQGALDAGENLYFPTTNRNGATVKPYEVYVSKGHDIQFELTVKCKAGTYLYIDNINVWKLGANVNIMPDPSFENLVQDISEFNVPEELPEISVVNSMIAPAKWDTSYNTIYYDRFVYLTSEAASGEYALAFKTGKDAVNYTLKQELPEVEADVKYHVELKARKTGDFTSVSLFETSTEETGNRNIISLINASSGIDKVGTRWTNATGTFTSRGGSSFNMYIVAEPNAIITIDDIVVYKDGDESKTNLLENGDFEEYYFVNGEQYRASRTFTKATKKVEAIVKFEADIPLTQEGGVLMGNVEYNEASINYGVTTYGRPYVYMISQDGTSTNIIFDKVNVYTGEWTQLGFEHTDETIDCYINGTKADSVVCDVKSFILQEPFVIGGDLREGNPYGFKGLIKDIKVYGESGDLMGAWNLEQLSNADMIEDESENKINLLHYGGYGCSVLKEGRNPELSELERGGYYIPTLQDDIEEYPYAFAAVGDTQYACKFDFVDHKVQPGSTDDWRTWQAELVDESKRNFGKIYDWIISQKESKNIKFVMGLGDITDLNTRFEWEYAQEVISKLNGQLPYSLLKGDHDIKRGDATNFDTYLAKNLISNSNSNAFDSVGLDYEEFGTYNAEYDSEGNLTAGTAAVAYHKLIVGDNHKWLILSLSHDTPLEALDWVNNVIEENEDYNVIVTTHNYLVNPEVPNVDYLEENYPDSYFSALTNGAKYDARELWDKVISQHKNIKFMLSGHRASENVTVHRRTGVKGNVVTELLINMQETDRMYGVQGLVSLLRFSKDGSRVKVETYSTVHNQYFKEQNQFVLDISMDNQLPSEVSDFKHYVKKTIDDVTAYEVQDLIQVTEDALCKASSSTERETILTIAKNDVDILANQNKSQVTYSQIRANDHTLRFVLEIDDSLKQYLEENYGETVEFGTLLARSDLYKGVLEYTGLYDKFSTEMATVVRRQSTYKPDNYIPVNTGETTVYTCVVRGIPDEFKDVEIRARSYVKFTDSSGNEHFIYGDEVVTTYNKTLNSASE